MDTHCAGRFEDQDTFFARRRNWRRPARGHIGGQRFFCGPVNDSLMGGIGFFLKSLNFHFAKIGRVQTVINGEGDLKFIDFLGIEV